MKKFALLVCLLTAAACKKGTSVVNVELQTSLGTIQLELDAKAAPATVENFVEYVESGFYDGTVFHRVINGFMIQGGGFDSNLNQKATRSPVKNEAANGLSNKIYTISMARTQDPNSATAQFFINLVDNERLDYIKGQSDGYTVFGKVTAGEDVVKKIGSVKTGPKGYFSSDVPQETVSILKAKVVKK